METENQIVQLYGAGRDNRTRSERRLNRFADRHFRIGDVIVRAGRRTPVTVGFLSGHVEAVVQHIERGALRLESHSDKFIDPLEFRALVSGTPLPVAQLSLDLLGPGDDDGDGGDTPEGTESYGEPAQEDSPFNEPSDEPTDNELANEPESSLSDEPMEETPDVSAEMATTAGQPLPDAWRFRNKKGLLALCAERKLDVTDKQSNRELTEVLERWETESR